MSEPDTSTGGEEWELPEVPEDREGSVEVLGTAHVSERSVDRVRDRIRETRPDVVAVELDEGRYKQMQGDAPDDLEAGDLLRGNTVYQFLAYWMLSYVQSRLGDRFDIEPGADMKAAIDAAEDEGLGVALVDRDIQVTIQRFWSRMKTTEKIEVVAALAFGVAELPAIAATTALFLGVFLAPILGIAAATVLGVPSAVAARVVAGGAAALVAGWATFEVSADGTGDSSALSLAIAGGGAVGAVVAALGLGTGIASAVFGGFFLYLAGGFVTGAVLGLGVGLVLGLVTSIGGESADLDEEFDVEDLTDADVVTAMLEEFRRFSPGGAEALIDERDAYIAHHLVRLREQGYDVLAVVGAGHREGIERYLANPETLPPFEGLVGPDGGGRFSVYKLLGYLFTLGFVVFFVLLVLGGATDAFLLRLFAAWFLFNGIAAFSLAKLAGAHWSSAGVGGAVAWLTSVNPLLAPGWFAGYVELRYVTVNVADIAELNEILKDEESPLRDVVSRLFDVPLFRLIMIVAMTNLGSMAASFLFPFVVVPHVAPGGDVAAIGDLLIQGAENGLDLLVQAAERGLDLLAQAAENGLDLLLGVVR
ncbi:conjugal transfer protein TraB [Halobacteriales archaeon QS_8_69_26]|nr:MAG: conjugal transfer protein TraB [Halobacteriales archaeon QS_8_69_26]